MPTSSNAQEPGSVGQATGEPPTYAAFAPSSTPLSPSATKQRTTILVHQKSPLLLATPPQVTRALAYSHPFLLPLNKAVGLISWTTGDPWESYLLVAAFWVLTLYGDVIIRCTGPLILVVILILGLYSRRFSPLSSTGWAAEQGGKGHTKKESEGKQRHHKSLDEIVDTLKIFTSRCNILLDPFLRLTDFLSTQRTATSATTRPALTTLFVRILVLSPFWYILTLWPLQLITTKRVILAFGTLVLTWHSRPARVSRTVMWRSKVVRQTCATVTGLQFGEVMPLQPPPLPPRNKAARSANADAAELAARRFSTVAQEGSLGRRVSKEGVRFTFTLFENQRRWVGIGWTYSMLPGERASWTDDQLNTAPSKDKFDLPKVEGGIAKWRWCEDSEWKVEGADDDQGKAGQKKPRKDAEGWIYFDNHWKDGHRQDGWGKYTRRRKWCRDAELVEVTPASTPAVEEPSSIYRIPSTPQKGVGNNDKKQAPAKEAKATPKKGIDTESSNTPGNDGTPSSQKPAHKRAVTAESSSVQANRGWFGRKRHNSSATTATTSTVDTSSVADDAGDDNAGAFTFSVRDDERVRGDQESGQSAVSKGSRESEDDGEFNLPLYLRGRSSGMYGTEWGIGEDAGMEFG